jgi:hypothetical protein
MRLSHWPVLIALLGVTACAGAAPDRPAAARPCTAGALDDEAVMRLMMAGLSGPVPVFGGCRGKALAFEAPREGRRRASTAGVLIALKP